MKTKLFSILYLFVSSLFTYAQGIGINETGTSPDPSAILDVSSSNKGVLPPRMTTTQRNAIADPAHGLMIYNTTLSCIEVNKGTTSSPIWDCLKPNNQSVAFNCNANGFQGSYVQGVSTLGRSFSVTVTNNLLSTVTINFSAADLVLSGVGGMTVGTPTGVPALTSGNATLNAGQSVVVTYPISGIPSAAGTLTGTWSKLSNTCSNTTQVAGDLVGVTALCDGANRGFSGVYVPGQSATFAGATLYRVRITNNGSASIQITPNTSDLTLSGASGLSIASVTPNTPQTIAVGGFIDIQYNLSGTVPSSGTVMGTFNKFNLSCSNTLILDNPPTLGSTSAMLTGCLLPVNNTNNLYSNWQSSNTSLFTVNSTTGVIGATATAGTAVISGLRTGTNYSIGFSLTSSSSQVTFNGNGSTSSTTGTLAIPAGVTSFEARVWGGGGAGRGRAAIAPANQGGYAQVGSGGGGGGYSFRQYSVSGTGSISYTAGRGGIGGTGNGGAGQASTLTYNSVTITANGGGGGSEIEGAYGSAAGGTGGTASGGTTNTNGAAGWATMTNMNNGTVKFQSCGNASPNGGQAKINEHTGNGNPAFAIGGLTGNAPGGGGTGYIIACQSCYSPDRPGGAGAPGRVRVNFTCPTN